MKCFFLFYILFKLVFESSCDTKIWKPSTDISIKENWNEKFENEECTGLRFAKINSAKVFIKSLRVKKLILPLDGFIQFQDDNSYLNLDESSNDFLNCVDLNPINKSDWDDFENWRSVENSDNPAVPHDRRLPCQDDDINFPNGPNSSVKYNEFLPIFGRSFKYGNEFYTVNEMQEILFGDDDAYYDDFDFYGPQKLQCPVPTRNSCQKAKEKNVIKCQNPVSPVGFCKEYKICGGHIILHDNSKKILEKIKRLLKNQGYQSGTYTGLIVYGDLLKIQIVFTEKEFSGKSLDEILNFYHILLEDKSLVSKNPELFLSGPYFEPGLLLNSTLSLIFGTLFGVILMFAILFYAYGSKGEISLINLRNRLVSTRPLSTHIFAKYNNLEDQARIFEGQSIAGSVLSLDQSKSFQSERNSPTTSVESLDTTTPKKYSAKPTPSEYSEIELSERKELHIESVNDKTLLKDL